MSESVQVDIWGARGSRSVTPPESSIANYTSCYSISSGEHIFVFDGGRGLGILSRALETEARFESAKSVQLFLSHAHMDHWEGIKDANWFWSRPAIESLCIWAPREAHRAVKNGYDHPSYVPLEILAIQKIEDLRFMEIEAGEKKDILGWKLRCFLLNHYSGMGDNKQQLSALGFRLSSPNGVTLSYMCDHEPTKDTEEIEDRLLNGADLAIVDAHFADRADHAFGHGSIEHAATLAKRYSDTIVLSAHHGPMMSDEALTNAFARHGEGVDNFALAIEGEQWSYDSTSRRFRLSQEKPAAIER